MWALTSDLAHSSQPLYRLGQPSTQSTTRPGIEPTASRENAVELAALSESL